MSIAVYKRFRTAIPVGSGTTMEKRSAPHRTSAELGQLIA